MLGLKNMRGGRGKAADAAARARTLPAGDQRRWQVLAELDDIGVKTVFDTAAELIEAGDRDSAVLGAEILDGVFNGRYYAARRFAPAGERLLARLCAPDQDPLLLATALHPYSAISTIADALARYRGDSLPAVRAAAIQATSGDDAERILALLTVELRNPEADRRFVDACEGRGFRETASDGTRSDAGQALTRLRERNWAARETLGRYPLADQREQLLAAAIEAVTP